MSVDYEWQREKDRRALDAPDFNASVVRRAQERMARVDAMPREVRELVYEFGLDVVQEFLNHHVTKPKSIRHLIATVLALDYDNGQRRFAKNAHKALSRANLCISVPREPTKEMIEASMREVSGHDVLCTKYEKHRRRLKAAIASVR